MSRKSVSSPRAVAVKLSCFHREITCHNVPKTLVSSAEPLSKCFFSALFSGRSLCAMPARIAHCELKRAPRSFYYSFHHWTHRRALCRWTHAAHPPRENTTGYIWGGALWRQEALLRAHRAKGCWSQLLARWNRADNSLYIGLSPPVPCHYLSIYPFVFALLFLRVTACHIFSLPI